MKQTLMLKVLICRTGELPKYTSKTNNDVSEKNIYKTNVMLSAKRDEKTCTDDTINLRLG